MVHKEIQESLCVLVSSWQKIASSKFKRSKIYYQKIIHVCAYYHGFLIRFHHLVYFISLGLLSILQRI